MNTSIDFATNYFNEEQIGSLFFIIIGTITVFLSLIFLSLIKYSFFKGLAIPLLFVGLLQLIVGITIYKKTPNDLLLIIHQLKNNSLCIQNIEIPRIESVLENFVLYITTEICLIIFGIIIILIYRKSKQTFWKGLGLGLLIQASIMLCLDAIAQQRAETYLQFLLKL